MRIALLLVLVACGDNGIGGGGGDDEPELAASLTTRTVATLVPDGITSMEFAALDERRVALARVDKIDGAFCPDCIGLDPSECPALCERALVSASVIDLATGVVTAARPIATVFPASFDHSVDQVEVVALGGERVGVAWLDCDNARCGGLAARRSCTARYTTLDLASGAVGDVKTLYTGWFGDLSLAFDQTSRRLLAVIAKDLVFGGGVFRAIFDDTAGVELAPWQPLGSAAARSPALLATGGRLAVFADDWSPAAAPRVAPCAESCECLDGGRVDLERGGLFAYEDGAVTRIASGRDPDGFYGRREQLAAIAAGGRTIVATTQSIDRRAELFAFDGAWTPVLSTPAPIPMWIGALGTRDHAAWIGAKPEADGQATIQRLVAGIAASDGSTFATLDDPLDRSVLLVEPVQTAGGVTTNVLLQGVFERTGTQLRWARFDVLAVDAAW